MIYPQHKSSTGMDANLLSMIIYLLPVVLNIVLPQASFIGWLLPLIIIFIEKYSTLVKFSAFQALFLVLAQLIMAMIIGLFSVIMAGGSLVAGSVGIFAVGLGVIGILVFAINCAVLALSIVCAIKAYNWTSFYIPIIGPWAKKAANEQSI